MNVVAKKVVAGCGVGTVKEFGRAALTGMLCALMAGQPVLAEAGTKSAPAANAVQVQVQGQERVLHALDRMTFGPRPGDVAAVQRMGLNKWFERQLNPGSIDDSALDQRLVQYPAMQMPLDKLEEKYPNPGKLRQMMNGNAPLPSNATDRAMVEDQIEFYKINKAKQEAAKATATDGTATESAPAMVPGSARVVPGSNAQAAPGKKQKQVQAGFDALNDSGMDAEMKMQEKPIPAGEIAVDAVMAGPAPDAAGREQGRAMAARIIALPPDQRMKTILAMSPKDLVKLRQSLVGPQLVQMTEGLSPQEKETLAALPGSLRMVALESMESRLMRDVYSDRQLEAVMTDFWLNHFNVYVRKSQQEPYLIPTYERETIRPRALGNFEDLLVATAKSPAMLVYLDNFRSVGPDSMQAGRLKMAQDRFPNAKLLKKANAGLNENYGRELMELHTLGVNGGYTQADVTNVAKVFTGWGLEGGKGKGYGTGVFDFDERRHEPGSKVVLGKTIKEGGEKEGLEVLHMLATSPATAHFISKKLAVRFVSDTPPAALVDRMAASFSKSNGDIKTVLRTMFNAPEFWAPEVYRAKVKTPEEFVISAVRASGAEVVNPQALVQSLDKLGMPLYGMQTPNGYSWTKDGWVSTGALVSRMNFALVLSGDRMPGVRTEWSGLLGEGGAGVVPASYSPGLTDPAAIKERRLEMVLLGQAVSERTRATVLGQSTDANVTEQAETQFDLRGGAKGDYAKRGLAGLKAEGVPDDPQAAVMAGLLLGSPEFQRR